MHTETLIGFKKCFLGIKFDAKCFSSFYEGLAGYKTTAKSLRTIF